MKVRVELSLRSGAVPHVKLGSGIQVQDWPFPDSSGRCTAQFTWSIWRKCPLRRLKERADHHLARMLEIRVRQNLIQLVMARVFQFGRNSLRGQYATQQTALHLQLSVVDTIRMAP